jgi:hypothetical protein
MFAWKKSPPLARGAESTFQTCPMTEPAGIKDAEPTKVLSGIVDIREEEGIFAVT